MAGDRTLGSLLLEADTMLNGLNANAADVAHLAARRDTVAALRQSLEAINTEQEMLKAQLQQATERVHAATAELRTELRLLRKGVQAVYGDRVQKLEEFGIKVRT